MPAEKRLCPVCKKVVGPWHKSGVHPKCAPLEKPSFKNAAGVELFDGAPFNLDAQAKQRPVGVGLSQTERDRILRRINGEPRPRR